MTQTTSELTLAHLEAYRSQGRGVSSGGELRFFCPIHGGDHQRSLAVNLDTGFYYCHSCHAKGVLADYREKPGNSLNQLAEIRRWSPWALEALGARSQNGCVHFPMRDADGTETGFKRRRGNNDPFSGGGKSLTNRGGHAGLFYPTPFPTDGEVLVVEGEADTAAALSADWSAVVGTAGANPGPLGKTALAAQLHDRHVVLAPDPDEGGAKWLRTVGSVLRVAGCKVRVIPPDLENKRDLDARLRDEPDKAAALRGLIEAAVPFEIKADPWKAAAAIPAQPENPTGAPDPAWKTLPTFSDNGAPIPLHVARHIYLKRPTLVSVNGAFWQYNGKVFAEVSTDEIDRDSTAIVLGRARRSVHGDIRHQLKLETLQPGDFFEPREASDYIALQNGMLDIRTCILHPHDPKWRARNLLPVVYDDMAECPRFTQALEEWLPDDPGARTLLEEFMGYCLVPDVSKEKALFLVGEGANGKGRFVRVLENLLGKSNVSGLPLMALRAERTFPTAGLVGKLLNICTETETTGGAQLDEGWIKALVSGDTVQVERKGCDPFSIRSNARFIIQSNNPPHISDKSEGFWRRLLLVRFPRSFHQEQQDPDLDRKLAAELPGILNLAIAGLRRLRERGHFEVTAAMMEALGGYRAENNPLATWREECLVQADPDWAGNPPRVSGVDAYASYREWCKNNGHNAYARTKFSREMGRLGLPCVKYREGDETPRGFEGVRLVLHM